jgi:hypothetical protein
MSKEAHLMPDHNKESRKALVAYWEKYGPELIRNDFLYTRGVRYVGGTQETQDLAMAWLRDKERSKERKEVFTLKPTLWGVGVDLKELGRRIRSRFQG